MRNKTTTPKKSEIKQNWHLVDAEGKILGKLAAEISKMLIGKNKAIYTPNINVGDKVVVINSKKIAVTGDKKFSKVYIRHTGFPGGLKSERLEEILTKKPNEAVRTAVKGMLPKNKLTKERMRNLYTYADGTHPHTAHFN